MLRKCHVPYIHGMMWLMFCCITSNKAQYCAGKHSPANRIVASSCLGGTSTRVIRSLVRLTSYWALMASSSEIEEYECRQELLCLLNSCVPIRQNLDAACAATVYSFLTNLQSNWGLQPQYVLLFVLWVGPVIEHENARSLVNGPGVTHNFIIYCQTVVSQRLANESGVTRNQLSN